MPREMFSSLVILPTLLASEGSLRLFKRGLPYHILVHVLNVSFQLILSWKSRIALRTFDLALN